ncbi:MAG TPA: FAD-dependent monooxygenase [Herpetosiphonaceae bacterium]
MANEAAGETIETSVLIVGAGPAGLMLACWLAKLGAPALVIDGKDGPTRESRALIVQARSLEVYDQLGVGSEVAARGRPVDGISMWRGRERIAHLELGPMGLGKTPHPRMFGLEQSQNEELLYERLRELGGDVRWRTTLERLEQDAAGVTAALRLPDGSPGAVRAAYVCGADGSHSLVRRQLGVAFEGSTNSQRFYVADVIADGALDEGRLNTKLTGETFLLAFPIKGADRFRLIGIMDGAPEGEEQPGFDSLRSVIEGEMGLAVHEVRWFATYKVNHRVAARFRQGRAFLLGDAAHVHSPVGGQGMNTGLLDAHNLAWKLAAVTDGRAEPRLLDSYEQERRPFAQALVRSTDRAFGVMTNPSALWRRLRGWLLPKVMGAAASRAAGAGEEIGFAPKALFDLVSQTKVSYRDSPLSRGARPHPGKVGGGDRLPYVPSASGSNFDALADAAPQIHVYGNPAPELERWADAAGLPVRTFAFDEAAAGAGLERDAAYLIRPDGYVSVAQARFNAHELAGALHIGWGWRQPEGQPARD